MSVLARLDDFRGLSRFTTWVYKFALLEAAVKLRRRAWQGREVPLAPDSWDLFSSIELPPAEEAEQSELLTTLQRLIAEVLTARQRQVLVALALNGVPIDVLAERLDTTRGALYKTLHDARRTLRKHLTDSGLALESWAKESTMTDLATTLERLLGPAEPEVGCDVCFDELDRYVELEIAGLDADAAVPGMRPHLSGCPACREDHESLLALASVPSPSPDGDAG